MIQLSNLQKSALQEAGNIGAGHAAIALSQLIGKRIMIAVSRAQILGSSGFVELIGGKESLVAGIFLKVFGDAQGGIVLVFSKEKAMNLVDVLLNQKIGTTLISGDMEQSALRETGSILSASYLNALTELLGMSLIPSVPKIMFDRAEIVIQSLFNGVLTKEDLILGIETEFVESSTKIKGYFLFVLNEIMISSFLKGLGVESNG